MAFADLLPHTVEVYARSGRRDRFGQQRDSNPSQLTGAPIATYPCRVYQKSGGLEMEERNIDLFSRVWEMFTDLDADVREDDAVRVLDSDGTVLVTLALIKDAETVYASSQAHHKEFMVWERTGPNPGRVA